MAATDSVSIAPARLADDPHHDVDVFFFGTAEQEARRHDAWFRSVAYINSKNAFMEAAERRGVPVPLTIPFDRVSAIGPDTIATAPHPCYIKAAISVSGVGIYRWKDQTALADALGRFDPSTPVQIQQEVVTDIFLNVQYKAGPFGLTRHAATEQILDGPVHQGNRYPAEHSPWDVCEPMADWLYQEGMRGVFAFDVAVVPSKDGPEYLAIECNPRYNGASYPTAAAKKLGIET